MVDEERDRLQRENEALRRSVEELEAAADRRGSAAHAAKGASGRDALSEEHESFLQLIDLIPLGCQSLDAKGRLIAVNDAWLALLGYEREEVLGRWFGDFLAPSFVDLFRERFPAFKIAGKSHVEFEMLHQNGERKRIAFDGRIATHEDGSFARTHCILQDITERSRFEQATRDRERDLLWAQRTALVGSWTFDPVTRMPSWSEGMFLIWGLDPAQGAPSHDEHRRFIHPDDWERFDAAVHAAVERGEPYEMELRIRRPDGEERTLVTLCTLERDGTGAAVRLRGTNQDITARKRAEESLRESESKYRALIESSNDVVFCVDKDGYYKFVNKVFASTFDKTPEYFYGKSFWDIYPKDHADQRFEASSKVFETGEPGSVEVVVPLPDRTLYYLAKTNPIKDQHGSVVLNLTTAIDITDRKRAEEALRESEEKFRLMIVNSPDLTMVQDKHGKLTYMSPQAKRVIGHDPESFAATKDHIHLEDRERARLVQLEALAGRAVVDFQYRFFGQDGEIRWLSHTARPLVIDGELQSVFSTVQDITARRSAEEERQALEEQLRVSQKMEAIGKLAGGVAHDFNNILSVILSYTAFAMESVREGDPLLADLEEIKTAGERAATLTRQLLAFSRKQVLQPVALDLNEVAVGVERMLRRILGEDIAHVQNLAPDLGVVLADPGQIEQVLMNLAVNARDAMGEGGTLTVETANVAIERAPAGSAPPSERHGEAIAPGAYVRVTVTDTGCGMDAETKARLFEPFFTTKDKGKGTGLGLSTVYGIIKQSGGDIRVRSEPGRGTTFALYLPREPSATVANALSTAAPKPTPGNETILVVEDEEALRRVAKRTLEAAGYRVLTAGDGNDALKASARYGGEIHLLLTDVVMPRMNGRTLALEIAKTRQATKVIYMSGYTDDAIVRHGVLEAGTNFIAKPFTAIELTRKLREVLDG